MTKNKIKKTFDKESKIPRFTILQSNFTNMLLSKIQITRKVLTEFQMINSYELWLDLFIYSLFSTLVFPLAIFKLIVISSILLISVSVVFATRYGTKYAFRLGSSFKNN